MGDDDDDPILDATILPDETPTQALARGDRHALAQRQPTAHLSLQTPGQSCVTLVPLTDDVVDALVADQLYIGFYNLSGTVPDPEDFEGLTDKTDEERLEMGLPPRRRLLVANVNEPLHVQQRVALAPMYRDPRRTRRDGSPRGDVLRCRLTFQDLAWVTHFAVGTRTSGILLAGAFARPYAMQAGNGFKFSVAVNRLRLPASTPSALLGCDHKFVDSATCLKCGWNPKEDQVE